MRRRRRAADRPRPGDRLKVSRLTRLFRQFNERRFGGLLPELQIRISGRMSTRLGQLCMRHDTGRAYEITLSRRHIERHGWAEAAHTLLHEMAHLWQNENGYPVGHGPLFRVKAEELGVVAHARRTVRTLKSRRRRALRLIPHTRARHGTAI